MHCLKQTWSGEEKQGHVKGAIGGSPEAWESLGFSRGLGESGVLQRPERVSHPHFLMVKLDLKDLEGRLSRESLSTQGRNLCG